MKDSHSIKRKNEEIARKFTRIETSVASCLDAKELFEKVLLQLEEEFTIPFVWISIINKPYLAGMIQTLMTSKILKDRLNIVDEETFFGLIGGGTKPVLANEGLKPFFKLLPRRKKYFIRSLAVAPIALHQEIIGSVNHGDYSPLRYQPDMDSALLQGLVSNISTRLSDIITCRMTINEAIDKTDNAD